MKTQIKNQMKKQTIGVLLIVLGLAFYAGVAFGADALPTVQVNASEAVTLPAKNVAKLAIADPAIADVVVLSEDEISVIGKKAGVTTLTVTHLAKAPTEIFRVVVGSSSTMALTVRAMVPDSNVNVREVGESLVIEGEVQDELELTRLQQVAEASKLKIVNLVEVKKPRQISIRTRVVEINTDASKKVGFKWFGPSGEVQYALDYKWSGKDLVHGLLQPQSATGLAPKDFSQQPSVDVILQLFVDNNIARLLSEPTLITRSGSEASFLVGEERPIVLQTATSFSTDYKKVGVQMKIKPVADSKNRILTTIHAEVSQVTGVVPPYSTPIIGTKYADTVLQVNDGQTIVIGGLLENNINRDYLRKVPWLGDIPLFGYLFRQKERNQAQREVLFLVTPSVVKDVDAEVAAAGRSPVMREWNNTKFKEKLLEIPKDNKPNFQFLEKEDKEAPKKAEPAPAAVAPKREPTANFSPAKPIAEEKAVTAPKAQPKAAPAKKVAPKPAPVVEAPVEPPAPKRAPTTNFGTTRRTVEEKVVQPPTEEKPKAQPKAAPAKKVTPKPAPAIEPAVETPAPKIAPTTNFGPARPAGE